MSTHTPSHYLEGVNRSIAYMEAHLDAPLRLDDVAAEAHLSPYHFHRIYKSLTGETVKEFIVRVRLENAARQLVFSSTDVGVIAQKCGYTNHETFTRAFKDYFQTTPSAYRAAGVLRLREREEHFHQNSSAALQQRIHFHGEVQLNDIRIAYIRHVGSYEKVGASFQRLMLWAAARLMLKWKPVTFGIVHDQPDLTAEEHIRFDACVMLNKPMRPSGEIGYKSIPAARYAVWRYHGPYESFLEVYHYVYDQCLFEHRFTLADIPALEWYIKPPPFYKGDGLVTDFYVPIK